MIVFINGSYGVGKSTVCRLLKARTPRSRIFDPERMGWVLHHLPRWAPFSTKGYIDYQDAAAWRRATIALARFWHFPRGFLFLPKAFSNFAYLSEIRSALEDYGAVTRHFCLTASEQTLRDRLARRGLDFNSREGQWILPRISVCCEAHRSPDFDERVSTENRSPEGIADDIAARLA